MSVLNFRGEVIEIIHDTLDLSGKNITDLSVISNLESLVNLEYLFLSDNKIKEIVKIGKLTKLVELSLSENEISEISNIENLNGL